MSNQNVVVHGIDLHFVPEQEPKGRKEKAVHTMLKLLCDDWNGGWKNLLNIPALKAILFKENPEFIGLLRQGHKDGFVYLLNQLQQIATTPEIRLQAQIYIQNCLCFLPYTNPSIEDTIVLPEWIDDKWQAVTYAIEPMLLTNPPKCGRFFSQPVDQFYAYGLTPVDTNVNVSSKLVFQASSYPAGKGFWIAVQSDMKAFRNPGETLLDNGQAVIDEWVAKQTKPVEFVGISLGGIMAIEAGLTNGNVAKVHAYNPPGFYKQDFSKYKDPIPTVHVIRNAREPASELGSFDPRFHIYLLKPEAKYQTKISLLRHALSFANKGTTNISELDVQSVNKANRKRDILYGPVRAAGDFFLIKPLNFGRAIVNIPGNLICRLRS